MNITFSSRYKYTKIGLHIRTNQCSYSQLCKEFSPLDID